MGKGGFLCPGRGELVKGEGAACFLRLGSGLSEREGENWMYSNDAIRVAEAKRTIKSITQR